MTSAGKRLRGKLEAGEPVFGLWAGIPSSITPELAGLAGYDYVCVDLQHGLNTEATLVSMFQAAQAGGAVPLARLAWNEPWLIMRALDLGAAGVILPLIDSAAEAARAVEACRYPPHGKRSYGPVRAELVVGSTSPDELGNDALCIAMIETRDGLDNLDEIAATPGLDGLYIGPSDLSLALGLPPRAVAVDPGEDRQALADAIERVHDACTANGLIPGMHCAAGQAAAKYADAGFKLITVGVDTSWYKAAIRRELDTARGG
ncbi:MAG TPA: aldolase/citrate lyase family protein [Solirubrobacteraceae bacterium]|nr:aldolase/citrate lyase family protein [Solirubrobacteraceae bacterium]